MHRLVFLFALSFLGALYGGNDGKEDMKESEVLEGVVPFEKQFMKIVLDGRQGFMDPYSTDRQLRALEKELERTVLPYVIQAAAVHKVEDYCKDFGVENFDSIEEALECRYIHTAILYKLGKSREAALLAQSSFEYLFPQLHEAVERKLIRLFGNEYKRECKKTIARNFFHDSELIIRSSSRIKSTHSIWRKVPSLEMLDSMTCKDFASCVNDFLGIRWEMNIKKDENRYDALINGIALAPMQGLISFRNQQLKQDKGFESEPVMKLCYIIENIPVELQLLGGGLNFYMCAKGYSNYKTKLCLPPRKENLSEEQWNRRLGMAIQFEEAEASFAFWENMYAELLGNSNDYSACDPFILDPEPLKEKNRQLRFSTSLVPISELAHLSFQEKVALVE